MARSAEDEDSAPGPRRGWLSKEPRRPDETNLVRKSRRQLAWLGTVLGAFLLVAVVVSPHRGDVAEGVAFGLIVAGGLCGAGGLLLWDRRLGYWLTWCPVVFLVAALALIGTFGKPSGS